VTEPIPYVPLPEADKGYRLAMGLRPLDLANWLEVDPRRRDAELAEKARLLAVARDTVVATRPAGDAAAAELLAEVVDWLAAHHPELDRTVDPDEHPIVAASRLVQEDLCVLVRSDAWRLESAGVCFPSRWLLATKIGTTLDEIHSPIPGYGESLSRPTAGVFERMTPERSFWRLNWTLLDQPDLHQPEPARASVADPVPEWYFRVERQTLRRLPVSGAVIFTIHNYVAALSDMMAAHDGFADRLLAAIDDAPPDMQAYKGWVGVSARLRDLLTP
jgi:dimethylamine monooxygenase subunit A